MTREFRLQSTWRLILADLKVPVARLLRRAALSESTFASEAVALSTEAYFRLWNALSDELGGPEAGLAIARAASSENFDPPIFAAFVSPNLVIAAERLARFKTLVGPLTLEVTRTNDRLVLALDCEGDEPLPALLGTTELVFLTELTRRATRSHVVPLAIESPHPGAEAFTSFFGRAMKKSKRWALSFSLADAMRPFLSESASMWSFFEPELRKQLAEVTSAAPTHERVHAALARLLPSGRAGIADVASALGITVRTLQRNLAREDTTFARELGRTRERLARHYLQSSSLPHAEISLLLGYDEPSSFFRAFRQWSGSTPEALRNASRA